MGTGKTICMELLGVAKLARPLRGEKETRRDRYPEYQAPSVVMKPKHENQGRTLLETLERVVF